MQYYTSHISKKLDIPVPTVRYWGREYAIGTEKKQGSLTVRLYNDDDIEKFEKVKRLRKDNWSKQDIIDQLEAQETTTKVQQDDRNITQESEMITELRSRIKSLESEKTKDREFFRDLIKSEQALQGDIKELVRNQQVITKDLQSMLLLPRQATATTERKKNITKKKEKRQGIISRLINWINS